MIPTSTLFDQSTIAALLDHDPLIADYRAFFALLDWSVVDQWEAKRSSRGRPAHPISAYLKAFLIRIRLRDGLYCSIAPFSAATSLARHRIGLSSRS